MEKGRPSKKKVNHKHGKPLTSDDRKPVEKSIFPKRSLEQPENRLAAIDDIWQETNVGQDFETLVNAPVSTAGHFVFKSEKNWSVDASKYDEFFSVDVKNLATIIECIPYNQYVEVDDKYFSKDELTNINNTVEKAKKAYDAMLGSIEKTKLESDKEGKGSGDIIDNSTSQSDQNIQCLDDDLDFLLSLEEPVRTHPVSVVRAPSKSTEEGKTKKVSTTTKSLDLEQWLDDLVLDD